MKNTAALGNATRMVGKLFFALVLLLAAVAVGFGGTALFVYHQFADAHRPAAQPARNAVAEHRAPARATQSAADGESAAPRRVVALTSDGPQYTYADNNGGQPSTPARRQRTTPAVPAALDASSQSADGNDSPNRLNDPEGRFMVDPRAIAGQTPPPEIRVAAPVLEDGQPVYHEATISHASVGVSQYLPVRKALPVTTPDAAGAARNFNAGEYMMNDVERPVPRAQAVVQPGARVVKSLRIYRLPDGSQSLAAE